MNILDLECDELLNEAIMSKTPIVLVEGVADIPVYEQLSEVNELKSEVYAIENIKGYAEGCRGVIDCLSEIRINSEGIQVEKYILGIIDRDARFYRGEIATDRALVILQFYSMESHFITKEATSLIIRSMTRATNSLLDEQTKENIHNTIKESLFQLFTLSLEALRNAVEEDYQALFGYGSNIQQIRNQGFDTTVLGKEQELNDFANTQGIERSWDSLLKICKGKWLFHEYCNLLQDEVATLVYKCKDAQVQQCQFCITESFEKCLYKVQAKFNKVTIRQLLFSNVKTSSLDYLVGRIAALG